jgi:alkaline phosphatase D
MRLSFCVVLALAIGNPFSLTALGQEQEQNQIQEISWSKTLDQLWLGVDFWANRLQDWQVASGRVECVGTLPARTAHLLTADLKPGKGEFRLEVLTGVASAGKASDGAISGFLLAAGEGKMDYRSASLIHQWPGTGGGFVIGMTPTGKIIVNDFASKNGLNVVVGESVSADFLPRDGWKVVAADSEEADSPASNVLDGDTATIWHTQWKDTKPKHPHHIIVDMGKVQQIGGIALLPRQSNVAGRILDYEIFGSDDGENWPEEALAKGKFSDDDGIQKVTTATTTRFIKLVANSAFLERPSTTLAEFYALKPNATKVKTEKEIGAEEKEETLPAVMRLVVHGKVTAAETAEIVVELKDAAGKKTFASKTTKLPAVRLAGNIALLSHNGGGKTRFWFNDLSFGGSKIALHPDRSLGPILSAQHTLSHNVLKLTAQFMPVSQKHCDSASLEIQSPTGEWQEVANTKIVLPGYTAPFKVKDWDDSRDTPYRVVAQTKTKPAGIEPATFSGTIRKNPEDKETIVVAGFTGNHMVSRGFGKGVWTDKVWFPHAEVTKHVAIHKPDVLFFSGDQIYEGGSPTFADRAHIMDDYLYKWYLWCWAYKDLTRDIPTVTIPDDHDVYQGNVWGQGGRKSPGRDHDGGYVHPAEFVKMVDRTQTSHLADAYDPTPIEQGIGVYYGPMTYGGVSFAVIEDRKFKSGCKRPSMPPSGTGRPDHFNDPTFDVDKLDVDDVQLLGERQLEFLEDWAKDWKDAEMKMALSQTIFANMATHHGGGLDHLIADLDSNGWPQTGRRKALSKLRKGFAFHLAGDQHLATVVHHGIEAHDDAIWSFAVPSVANFYPRAWAPELDGAYEYPEEKDYLGRRQDGFKNLVNVYAASNPGKDMGREPADLHNGMPGYGIVKLNKDRRTIRVECWPRFADPADPAAKQYQGWPIIIDQTDNYGKEPLGYLPTLEFDVAKPVLEVYDENNGELVYALRIQGRVFKPKVFADGKYTVKVHHGNGDRPMVLEGLKIAPTERLKVEFLRP